jgi:hypothetical protein
VNSERKWFNFSRTGNPLSPHRTPLEKGALQRIKFFS